MENCIGEKTTFWALVKHNITIPTLQRDYIYGAQTEKTDEVLNNMHRKVTQENKAKESSKQNS